MYQIYNLNSGNQIALPQENRETALSLARLSSAINRTYTAVVDKDTAEVIGEYLEGLRVWPPAKEVV